MEAEFFVDFNVLKLFNRFHNFKVSKTLVRSHKSTAHILPSPCFGIIVPLPLRVNLHAHQQVNNTIMIIRISMRHFAPQH